ncbi:MAG: phosphoribosylglycinamide formyltransferase [Tidjanibacter sp.]|nr:phosphoribosylglycinamide formyltransferase [Tidjanibacter sp.]MBQ2247922.1 phosphoribosylglycinamide formyltransferase [Tidjanibacter sp.]
MKRLAIFASGSGSNFEAIAEGCRSGAIVGAEVVLCVCDKAGAYVIERAKKFGVETLVFNPKEFGSKREFEGMIADRMDALGVDLVCLAGYMRIIGDELLERYGGKIINIHPALLPAFPGAHGIRDAFEYGVKVYGVTIHYVDATLDGGKIISQVAVPYEGDDIEELEAMIHKAEHKLYVETINKL